jgi:hypothetical protein
MQIFRRNNQKQAPTAPGPSASDAGRTMLYADVFNVTEGARSCRSLFLIISSENLHAPLDLQVGGSDNKQATKNATNNTNNKQQTTNNKQQTTNNQHQTSKNTNDKNKQPTTNNKQRTTNNKQQRTKHKQLTTYEVGPRFNRQPHPTRHTLGLGA